VLCWALRLFFTVDTWQFVQSEKKHNNGASGRAIFVVPPEQRIHRLVVNKEAHRRQQPSECQCWNGVAIGSRRERFVLVQRRAFSHYAWVFVTGGPCCDFGLIRCCKFLAKRTDAPRKFRAACQKYGGAFVETCFLGAVRAPVAKAG
jgi:hypothetical protein